MASTRSQGSTPIANWAVGYLRRSTDRQEQSIPDQRKSVEEYARDIRLPSPPPPEAEWIDAHRNWAGRD